MTRIPGLWTAKYLGAALLLGVAWSVALMVPAATRTVIVEESAVRSALLLCAVSVIVAVIFRRPIAKAHTWLRFALLALGLPFVGAALWFSLLAFLNWLADSEQASVANFGVTVATMLPLALGEVAESAYYVVIPMGLLSQYVMHRAARGGGS